MAEEKSLKQLYGLGYIYSCLSLDKCLNVMTVFLLILVKNMALSFDMQI